jgi:parallel beta-helix repeat protein
VQGIGANFSQQGWTYAGEALHLRGTRSCLVEECRLDQVGGNGIYLERGNVRSAVRRCEVAHAGANGIVLAGDRPFHPLFCEVTDNDVHHAGALINLVAGISLGTSDACVVAHNSLHDLPHHAVQLGANGLGRNYVEYNEIRRVCLAIHDTGAINSWMDVPSPWVEVHGERSGHVIRHNLIVDVPGCRVEDGKIVEDLTTRGIYLDDYTSNCLVVGNVVVRAGMGLQYHSGKHNTVENNLFIDTRIAFWACDFPPLRAGNAHTKGAFRANRHARNIFTTTREDAFLYWMHAWTDEVFERIDGNVTWAPRAKDFRVQWEAHPAGLERSTYAEWQAMGFDRGSVVADPRVVGPAGGDYRLAEDSPAWALGWERIPLERIGIRPKG